MAKKVPKVLRVPPSVAGSPEEEAKWIQSAVQRIFRTGRSIGSAGEQQLYLIAGTNQVVVARPDSAADRIEQIFRSLLVT